jgi:hypothetical protein
MKFKSSSLITHRSAAQLTVAKTRLIFVVRFVPPKVFVFGGRLRQLGFPAFRLHTLLTISQWLSSTLIDMVIEQLVYLAHFDRPVNRSVTIKHFDRLANRTVSVFCVL